MTRQGEENSKIVNFPFGYKKLCILIEKSLSILPEKEHSSAYFEIKVLFFYFKEIYFISLCVEVYFGHFNQRFPLKHNITVLTT